ncbi:hypothetical protein KCP77_02295 [Salmonella enterica subsp. enterica]|nr:hypothetical protein KCP77_02295 [Salmonella enterica subsp. enterica]
MRLGGWDRRRSPGRGAITAATPDGRIAISTDATTHVSGSDMAVTVTLKDGRTTRIGAAA